MLGIVAMCASNARQGRRGCGAIAITATHFYPEVNVIEYFATDVIIVMERPHGSIEGVNTASPPSLIRTCGMMTITMFVVKIASQSTSVIVMSALLATNLFYLAIEKLVESDTGDARNATMAITERRSASHATLTYLTMRSILWTGFEVMTLIETLFPRHLIFHLGDNAERKSHRAQHSLINRHRQNRLSRGFLRRSNQG